MMNKNRLFRRIIAIFAFLTITLAAQAQQGMTKVTLKSGITLVGKVKSFDPTKAIVLEVGGIESTINMADVQSVGKAEGQETAAAAVPAELPEEVMVKIAGVDVKFVLVKGGTFIYGYDGKGSTKVFGDPVHHVVMSDFYVTENPVQQDLVRAVMGRNVLENVKLVVGRTRGDASATPQAPVDDTNRHTAFFNISDDDDDDIANWKDDEYKLAKDLPTAMIFVNKARGAADRQDFSIMTETQWAYIKSTGKTHVNIPFNPEVVASVNMFAPKDPAGTGLLMLKGSAYNI